MTTAQPNGAVTEDERAAQKEYWKEHSGEATVEAMMLDSMAADIDKLERPEVRSVVLWHWPRRGGGQQRSALHSSTAQQRAGDGGGGAAPLHRRGVWASA